MLLENAKHYLKQAGFRLIKEGTDIYSDIIDVLVEDGYTYSEAQNYLQQNHDIVEEMLENNSSAFDVAAAIEGNLEAAAAAEADETPELELGGDNYGDIEDYENFDESYLEEGKSRGKSDRFSHREKAAFKNKKKSCCEEDDDDDLDESYLEEGKSKPKGDKFAHKEKVANKKKKCYDCDDDCDDDDLDEAFEDAVREPRGQEGAADWSDFKDNFRAKTLLLNKALTPKFVSELIKRTDFEYDEKDIKAYAISVIENSNLDAQNPVGALQRKISRHFTGV